MRHILKNTSSCCQASVVRRAACGQVITTVNSVNNKAALAKRIMSTTPVHVAKNRGRSGTRGPIDGVERFLPDVVPDSYAPEPCLKPFGNSAVRFTRYFGENGSPLAFALTNRNADRLNKMAAPGGSAGRAVRCPYLRNDVAASAAHPRQRGLAPGHLLQHVAAGVVGTCAGDLTARSVQWKHLLSRAADARVFRRDATPGRDRGAAGVAWDAPGTPAQHHVARRNRCVRNGDVRTRPVSHRQPRRGTACRDDLRVRPLPVRAHHAHGTAVDHVDAARVSRAAQDDRRVADSPWTRGRRRSGVAGAL